MASITEIKHPDIAQISVLPSKAETAHVAAHKIIRAVNKNPDIAITYATGETMIPVYAELAKAHKRHKVDFSHTQAFHLDEYYPCSPTEAHGFVRFLNEYVFGPLEIPEDHIHTLDGLAKDPNVEADRYDALVTDANIAIALLGIGPGGHIGFNEQGTSFFSRTHFAPLSAETIHRDRVDRGQDSPTAALTQGIATILDANQLLLIAYGANKGDYLRDALYKTISTNSPASALRLAGDKVSMVIDAEAAARLE